MCLLTLIGEANIKEHDDQNFEAMRYLSELIFATFHLPWEKGAESMQFPRYPNLSFTYDCRTHPLRVASKISNTGTNLSRLKHSPEGKGRQVSRPATRNTDTVEHASVMPVVIGALGHQQLRQTPTTHPW